MSRVQQLAGQEGRPGPFCPGWSYQPGLKSTVLSRVVAPPGTKSFSPGSRLHPGQMHVPGSVIFFFQVSRSSPFYIPLCLIISSIPELSLPSTRLTLTFSLRMGAVDSSARPREARAGSRRRLPRICTGGHQCGRSGPGDASGRRASRPGAAGAGGAPAWEEQAEQHLRPPRVQAGGRRRGRPPSTAARPSTASASA